jgi:DNA-binding XRE family transcriptional regulator
MQEEISFGTWLRKQRRALDLTRQAFADEVGCAEVTLRRIEAGTLKPSKELASIILEKLSIPEVDRPQWISFARGTSGFPVSVNLANKTAHKPACSFNDLYWSGTATDRRDEAYCQTSPGDFDGLRRHW